MLTSYKCNSTPNSIGCHIYIIRGNFYSLQHVGLFCQGINIFPLDALRIKSGLNFSNIFCNQYFITIAITKNPFKSERYLQYFFDLHWLVFHNFEWDKKVFKPNNAANAVMENSASVLLESHFSSINCWSILVMANRSSR